MRRGIAALLLGVAWFAFGAPAVNDRISALRVQPRGQRSAAELRAAIPLASMPPDLRADVAEAEAAARRERDWSLLVGGLLSTAERADGLARAAAEPLVLGPPGRSLEPELPVLIDAIHARYGPATAPIPAAPLRDDWPMIDRRARASCLLALLRGPGLDADRAAVLLAATLDLLATQARRAELEERFADIDLSRPLVSPRAPAPSPPPASAGPPGSSP